MTSDKNNSTFGAAGLAPTSPSSPSAAGATIRPRAVAETNEASQLSSDCSDARSKNNSCCWVINPFKAIRIYKPDNFKSLPLEKTVVQFSNQ